MHRKTKVGDAVTVDARESSYEDSEYLLEELILNCLALPLLLGNYAYLARLV